MRGGLQAILEGRRAILECPAGHRGFLECLLLGMVTQAWLLQALASKDSQGQGRLAIRDSQECSQELARGLACPECNPEWANWERPNIRECLHSKGWVCHSTPAQG